MKLAIIDIGSNSVRLMLSADGKTLYKKLCTTRLGAGLAQSGILAEEPMENTLRAAEGFCAEGFNEGAQVYAFATAAVRTAQNGREFCARFKQRCGVAVDVVSGENEALLGVLGALGKEDGGIIDIGGASTEVCYRKNGETLFSVSIGLGAVTLHDTCGDDPEKLKQAFGALSRLDGIASCGKTYVIGGTASTLAQIRFGLESYDAVRLQNLPMSRAWVTDAAENLLKMSVTERTGVKGMDERRADVIAGATFLLSEIMKKLSCREVFFSDRDNLEGYVAYRGLA